MRDNTYMVKAGLLVAPERGVVEITPRGKKVLQDNPAKIDVQFLSQFAEFQTFRATRHDKGEETSVRKHPGQISEKTPEELFEGSFQEMKDD